MTEITVGTVVKTSDGTTGRVARTVAVNGVTFHRLQRLIVTTTGRVIETHQRAFVQDAEIVAFRAMPAQPVAVWTPTQTTEQLIASARDAFEMAMEPVEAEYAETEVIPTVSEATTIITQVA